MPSRMDRYYENHPETSKRTHKNSNLYNDIYMNKNCDNIEQVDLNVGKKIDIRDVKALLEKRENYNNVKDYRIVKPEEPVTRKVEYYEEESTSIHDLNEMLDKAKEEKPLEEKRRHLEDTQVLTLQELVNSKSYAKKKKIAKEEVKDLINTICDNNLLSSEAESEAGLLDDLKATGHTIASTTIRQVLDEAKKEEEKENKMDDSFFTSSMGFKPKELEEMKNDDSIEESNSKTYTFLIILTVVSIIIFAFIIIKFML